MSTLASLIVNLEVQSAQLRKGLDEATKKLADFGQSTKKLGEVVGNVFSFAVAKAGLDRFAGFLQQGAAALADEEKSAGRLSAAFAALGYDAQKVAPYFNDLAEQLEDETLVAGETIRQVEQLLVQFGVAPREIEKTTRAILDYSAATGKDAVGAAQQLVTSVAAGKDEIRKMGISIQDTGDITKNTSAAVDQLTERFGGSAVAATAGLAGQLGHLQKAQEDLGKAFARFFVESDTGKAVINALTEAMDGMTYALSKEASAQAASVHRTEQLTKLREQLADAEKRLALERGRQGTWLASAGALDEAKRERNAIVEKINLLEAAKIEANHATDAESARARASEEAAQKDASRQAKEIANADRLKKAHEAAAAAGKKAAEEREAIFKRLTSEAEKWAEAQAKAAGDYERAVAGGAADVAARRMTFERAGTNAGPDTRGLASFDAALERLTLAIGEEAALREKAAMAVADGDVKLQVEMELRADKEKAAAENAGKAADAFVQLKEASAEAERAMREQAKSALDAMIAKAIGPVGGLVQAGTQGATAGAVLGPAGAIAGAFAGIGLELLTQSAQFQKLADAVGKVLQIAADGLGQLLEPLFPFVALVEPLAVALGAITGALANVLAPALELLWNVLKPVVMVVLKVVQVLGSFWNGLVSMLQDLLRSLGNIKIFGAKPLSFLGDWADGLDKAKVNLEGVDAAFDKLNDSTFEGAKAQVAGTDAQDKLTAANEKATASQTNVPAGYKVELGRYNAAMGDSLRSAGGARTPTPPLGLGGGSSSTTSGTPTASPAEATPPVHVYIDGDEVLQRLRARQQQLAQRSVGRAVGLNPRLVGAS